MPKISLIQRVESQKQLNFNYTEFGAPVHGKNGSVQILELAEPIPVVIGREVNLPNGNKHRLRAENVTEINVHSSTMIALGDQLAIDDETLIGECNTKDAMLDVDADGKVWLRTESFLDAGRTLGRQRTYAKYASTLQRQGEDLSKMGFDEAGIKAASGAVLNPVDN